MLISGLKIHNWRNFLDAEAHINGVTYVLGPNASGKSNLLDVFRFLRDVAKTDGGGLQRAVSQRGGLSKVRCLHARKKPEISIEVNLKESSSSKEGWVYELSFSGESSGKHRPIIKYERVTKIDVNGSRVSILDRPDVHDDSDPERLTSTAIENVQVNKEFRRLSEAFAQVTYLHLVPQLLKFSDQISGKRLEDDPFGQGFLEKMAECSEKTRSIRLKRIESALQSVIPRFTNLKFVKDDHSGRPHLEMTYQHHRPFGARQREDQFSDGTLRLISLLWLLQDGDKLLLLEEPELSLNNEVIKQIPRIINLIQRKTKKIRQIIITTHSDALLSDKAIDKNSILILTPNDEGTTIRSVDEAETLALDSGFSVAEAVLPRAQKLHAQMDLGL
ncbi:MAG: AAA family ATPase [Hyphomicrobiales bacterium]